MEKVFFYLAIVALLVMGCKKDDNTVRYVIDFEDASVGTAPDVSGVFEGGYKHSGSGLIMPNEKTYYADWDFWSWSGIAVSKWNDMSTAGISNQLSVYYSHASTKKGGYSGSEKFAVFNDGEITFDDDVTEFTFEYLWVANSTYAVLSMMEGDMFAKKFSYSDKDWFKLIITAYDKNDTKTGSVVEFYLADFRTSTSPGIITEWTKLDLSPLGNKVHTLKFDLHSSDTGDWGMNTPAYFCFDNLAIKK